MLFDIMVCEKISLCPLEFFIVDEVVDFGGATLFLGGWEG